MIGGMQECVFKTSDPGRLLPWLWSPKDRLQEREEVDPLWHQQGFLEAPRGRAIDRRAIAVRLGEIAGMFDLRGVA